MNILHLATNPRFVYKKLLTISIYFNYNLDTILNNKKKRYFILSVKISVYFKKHKVLNAKTV